MFGSTFSKGGKGGKFIIFIIYIMPRKTSKNTGKKTRKSRQSKKQKVYLMRGCASKSRKMNSTKDKNPYCSKCPPNCCCGPNCNHSHKCPGTCYLRKQKGGEGCGPCGCPIAPLSWEQMKTEFMNKHGGKRRTGRRGHKGGLKNVMQGGPLLGSSGQHGGSLAGGMCSTGCGTIPVITGGSHFYKPGGPSLGPIVGEPWGPKVSQWPGVDGISGNRNWLHYNNYPTDISRQMKLGGKRNTTSNSSSSSSNSSSEGSTSSSSLYGGGILPQDLVNLGSNAAFNFQSAYNAINGYAAPTNPLPYKDQLTGALNSSRIII
jgi:hypothetical protein